MKPVTLKAFTHHNQECIGIYFTNNSVLNAQVRKINDVRWSQSNKCWYLPLNKDNYNKIVLAVKGLAEIDKTELYNYICNNKNNLLLQKKSLLQKENISNNNSVTDNGQQKYIKKVFYNTNLIFPVNDHILPAMTEMLQLKAYSSSTIKTYVGEMGRFLVLLRDKPAENLKASEIKRYLVYCFEKLKLKENTLHSRMNALKFYYEQVLGMEKIFWEIPRPKKQQQNPHFFNQDEITRIIKQTKNIKHKTMLMLAYGTGMRVSEVTKLKIWQIDSKRMQIIVEQAKGKKDRVAALSPVLLVMLREYFITYKPKKEGYLFCGQDSNEPYSTRSLQLVLQAAKQRAGILKPGSVHALRHSFATHLLDKGTDVTMIMKLLGHNDIKTTLRYLHVTNRDVLQIISPLDQLVLD